MSRWSLAAVTITGNLPMHLCPRPCTGGCRTCLRSPMCHRRGGSSSRKPVSPGLDRPPSPTSPPLLPGGSQEKARHQPRVGSYSWEEGGKSRMSGRENVQSTRERHGFEWPGSTCPRITVSKRLCCFLLAAGSLGCRGRPRAWIGAISRRGPECLWVWVPGGVPEPSRILNQRQCKFSRVRPYTQMSDSVEGRCP